MNNLGILHAKKTSARQGLKSSKALDFYNYKEIINQSLINNKNNKNNNAFLTERKKKKSLRKAEILLNKNNIEAKDVGLTEKNNIEMLINRAVHPVNLFFGKYPKK